MVEGRMGPVHTTAADREGQDRGKVAKSVDMVMSSNITFVIAKCDRAPKPRE
jgi:hypothetical protein